MKPNRRYDERHNDDELQKRIQNAFNPITSNDELNSTTLHAVMQKAAQAQEASLENRSAKAQSKAGHSMQGSSSAKQTPFSKRPLPSKPSLLDRLFSRRLIPLAACLLVVLVAFIGGYQLYFTPTAAISVDVNPSVELEINRFDRVISANAYNDDGQQVIDTVDVQNKTYEEALDILLANSTIQDLLNQGELLSLSVACDDDTQSSTILSALETCAALHQNAYCHRADTSEVEAAHHAGMSFGKYQAYLAARESGADITEEDACHMTMRELHDAAGASEESGHASDVASVSGESEGVSDNRDNRGAGHQHHRGAESAE